MYVLNTRVAPRRQQAHPFGGAGQVTSRSQGESPRTSSPSPVRPRAQHHRLEGNLNTVGQDGAGGSTETERMVKRAEELAEKITELEARIGMEDEQARRVLIAKAPERPTQEKIDEHMVTHAPPKPWCQHCVRATTSRDPHRTVHPEILDVEVTLNEAPTVSFDLMYLNKKGVKLNLVVVDHESGRIWSHTLPDKSVLTGNGWIQNRVSRDINNIGHKEVKVMIKSRQRSRDGRTTGGDPADKDGQEHPS